MITTDMIKFLIFLLFVAAPLASQEPLKIAVVDTGLNLQDNRFYGHLCSSGHKDFTNTGLSDTDGHGTHVAGLIQRYAGTGAYCLIILKVFTEGVPPRETMYRLVAAFNYAASLKVKVINLSGGGNRANVAEFFVIKYHPNIIFSVAAGNDMQDLDVPGNYYYPASYNLPNIQVVGGLNLAGGLYVHSNYGSVVKYWEPAVEVDSTLPNGQRGRLTGTSMSTAIHTGRVIYQLTH